MTIPNSITTIGEWAFSGCIGITKIHIPDGVTCIEDNAFSGSGLTEVYLPKTIEQVISHPGFGEVCNIFSGCEKLKKIYVPRGTKDTFDKMGLRPYYDMIVEL